MILNERGNSMKSFKIIYLMSLTSIIFHTNSHATDSIITFFIKKAQTEAITLNDQRPIELVSEQLTQPEFVFGLPSKLYSTVSEGVPGITAIYLGYITTSNKNGQISFPRKQQNDQMYVLITPQILPTFMIAPSLIYDLAIDPSQPVEMYEINRKKDKKLNTYYFDVINIKKAIKNKNTDKKTMQKYINILTSKTGIPLNTIILLTDPANINIPTGISLNHYSPNLILPTFTMHHEIDTTENSLYTLSIKQYFEQINIESKNDSPRVMTIIANQ